MCPKFLNNSWCTVYLRWQLRARTGAVLSWICRPTWTSNWLTMARMNRLHLNELSGYIHELCLQYCAKRIKSRKQLTARWVNKSQGSITSSWNHWQEQFTLQFTLTMTTNKMISSVHSRTSKFYLVRVNDMITEISHKFRLLFARDLRMSAPRKSESMAYG